MSLFRLQKKREAIYSTGIQRIEMTTKNTTNTRPTTISSMSLALGLTRFHKSIVNITEQELKTLVSEDIKAAIITATMRPRAPAKIINSE